MNKKYTVFIADDHTLYCDSIKNIINKNKIGNVSATFNNGKSLLDYLSVSIPDLIILDINMPEMNGYEVAKIICKNHPTIKILIVSMNEEIKKIKELKLIGVSGYISKFIGEFDLIEAIDSIKKGCIFFPILDVLNKIALKNGINQTQITDSEVKIMKLVIEGFSSKEIADQLFLSIHTINTHRKNIIRKTALKNPNDMINYLKNNNL